MDNNIISALKRLNPSELTYQEWVNVGFALQHEGYDWTVWDEWSRNDKRYKPGECERKWRGFCGSPNPVTGASIVQMAKEHGWMPFGADGALDWNDTISDDGAYFPQPSWNPASDLSEYLKALFKPDDIVGFVTQDVWLNSDGEWSPGRGIYDRTARELLESLERHPEDIGRTVYDWKPDAGAWIRFNPLDGRGVRNENVAAFRFALVESDDMPIPEQDALYRKLELPIAALVHSGGKSLHAIVHIDAPDYEEYRKRVDKLYTFLECHGMKLDKQNRNPSRLSRMPGVTRNGNRQYLVATNIGRASWNDWLDFAEGVDDPLPPMESLEDALRNPPKVPDELIEGILRCGHKMLISGASKAGKSFLLMELCIAISEGRKWLGFQCKQAKVLYINLEIDPASCVNRFATIYKAKGISPKHADDLIVWNLRGRAVPLDQLVPKLVRRVSAEHYAAIVIDPIYKVITGDENNASDMGAFCNQFDRICAETGAATIYCHHHSKGAQGDKEAKDRASGSGVFARDPDAQLDMIEVQLEGNAKEEAIARGMTAWRLESSLREFKNIEPVSFWFTYPIHSLDADGKLADLPVKGSMEAARQRNPKYSTKESRDDSIRMAYMACAAGADEVTVTDMAKYMDVTERCVRDRIKDMPDEFKNIHGVVKPLTVS